MRRSRFSLVVVLLAPLAACHVEAQIDCTMEARSSVNVVVEGVGDVQAAVTYSRDGGLTFEACDGMGDAGEVDASWVCGWEVAGELIVRVEAEGFEPQDVPVTVEADVCHVLSESLTVTMQPVVCTSEVVPSVFATVTDESGLGIADASVAYEAVERGVSGDCESSDALHFRCGEELPGAIAVSATAPGYAPQTAEVLVEANACHVVTEEIGFMLARLPD